MFKRVFLLTLVGAAVAAVTSGPIGAQSGPRMGVHVGKREVSRPYNTNLVILYDQYNNPGTFAVNSQNFEAVYDAYDDFLADDFTTPPNQRWGIQQIDIDGLYYNGTGPAASFNIFVHKTVGSLPKDPPNPTTTRLAQSYTVVGASTFRITVSPTISIPPLGSGQHLWISLQANQNFAGGTTGQFGWTTRTVQSNSPAAWKNPGGGFGICPTWGTLTTCIAGLPANEKDLLFTLSGFHTID